MSYTTTAGMVQASENEIVHKATPIPSATVKVFELLDLLHERVGGLEKRLKPYSVEKAMIAKDGISDGPPGPMSEYEDRLRNIQGHLLTLVAAVERIDSNLDL